MSNPIADNVEYFIQSEQTTITNNNTIATSSTQNSNKNNNSNFHRHSYHTLLRQQQEEQSRLQQQMNGAPNGISQQVEEESLLHSIFRRMSVNMTRHEQGNNSNDATITEELSTPQEQDQLSPMFTQYHYDIEALRQSQKKNLLPTMLGEDDNLPSMEEISKENARIAHLAEKKSNYFEHPFEFTSLGIPWEHYFHQEPPQQQRNNTEVISKVSTTPLLIDGRPISKPYDIFDSLEVNIADLDESGTLYIIRLQYGDIRWSVTRSISEFYDLWVMLKFRSTIDSPPSFPSKLQNLANAIAIRRAPNNGGLGFGIHEQQHNNFMIHFSNHDDYTRGEKRKLELIQYLQELVYKSKYCQDLSGLSDLCEFLEISGISIVRDMGRKGKEGYLELKAITRSKSMMRSIRRNGWVKLWFILRESYVAICKDTASLTPTDVMLFEKDFSIEIEERKHFSNYSLVTLRDSQRKMQIRVQKGSEEWLWYFHKIKENNPWFVQNRYASYAPKRKNVKVKWFVDGHDYFEAVAEAILSAKSDIFIEDWWLSPQLYLRRPPKGNIDYRIDRLLKRKATLDNVKVYVVIYKSVNRAVPLDSQHTKHWLQGVHPNIIVLRHANRTISPLWAHHEKILVIDQRLAFVGGLDLCFGRYDTHNHELTDYASDDDTSPEIFPGQDYSNPRIQDFINVSDYRLNTVNKRRIARMPWHDIHTGMVGLPARDIARHFIQRWNFIKRRDAKDRSDIPYLLPKGDEISPSDIKKFNGTCEVQIIRSVSPWSMGTQREYSIYNAYMECISKAQHYIYIENQFFITTTNGKDKLIHNNIGEVIVNRIIRAHKEKQKFRVIIVIPTAPGFEGDFANPDIRSMTLRSVAHYQYMSISRGGHSVLEKLKQAGIPIEEYIGFYSLRNWGKIKSTPNTATPTPLSSSIINVKEDGSPPDSATTVTGRNSLDNSNMMSNGSHLGRSNSIKRTNSMNNNKNKKQSRGLSVMSIKNTSNSSRIGATSSTTTIEEPNVPPQQQQRRSTKVEYDDDRMEYVTEQVYIHSKLMIVDDKTVICGSANINDRSQLGGRDSEIATIIEDRLLVDSRMNGLPYQASKFALTLRMQLFKEHLGILNSGHDKKYQDSLVMDPLHDGFYYNVWTKTAQDNTKIYRDIFHCVPDDTISTFEAHRQVAETIKSPGHVADPAQKSEEHIKTELNKIRGHLVTFPTEYLNREKVKNSLVQELFPSVLFT